MDIDKIKPQILTLYEHEDGKKWVAELVGADPIYKLKRDFLPEIEPNTYELFDGFYQIHGIHPGITPFTKEYCRVINGQMTRYLSFREMLGWIPQMEALMLVRMANIKEQIIGQLDSVNAQFDHYLIQDEIMYQKEQVDLVDDAAQLNQILAQLIRQKPRMIKNFQELEKLYGEMPEY